MDDSYFATQKILDSLKGKTEPTVAPETSPDITESVKQAIDLAGGPSATPSPPQSPGFFGQLLNVGPKLGLQHAVTETARAFDPLSVMTGMGVMPTPEDFANAPETREDRAKLAERTMNTSLFPRGTPQTNGFWEEVAQGIGSSWPTLASIAMTGGFGTGPVLSEMATPVIRGGVQVVPGLISKTAQVIGSAALPFAITGLTEENPIVGAAKGAALGTALGGMHLATNPIEKPFFKWLAKIGGGMAIGGGATAAAGGGVAEISRDAVIFGLFEAMGMPRKEAESPATLESMKDKISDQAYNTLKDPSISTTDPKFISAVDEIAKRFGPVQAPPVAPGEAIPPPVGEPPVEPPPAAGAVSEVTSAPPEAQAVPAPETPAPIPEAIAPTPKATPADYTVKKSGKQWVVFSEADKANVEGLTFDTKDNALAMVDAIRKQEAADAAKKATPAETTPVAETSADVTPTEAAAPTEPGTPTPEEKAEVAKVAPRIPTDEELMAMTPEQLREYGAKLEEAGIGGDKFSLKETPGTPEVAPVKPKSVFERLMEKQEEAFRKVAPRTPDAPLDQSATATQAQAEAKPSVEAVKTLTGEKPPESEKPAATDPFADFNKEFLGDRLPKPPFDDYFKELQGQTTGPITRAEAFESYKGWGKKPGQKFSDYIKKPKPAAEPEARTADQILDAITNFNEPPERASGRTPGLDRLVMELGQTVVPGLRASDATEAAQTYMAMKRGEVTPEAWDQYVEQLKAEGRVKGYKPPEKPTPPVTTSGAAAEAVGTTPKVNPLTPLRENFGNAKREDVQAAIRGRNLEGMNPKYDAESTGFQPASKEPGSLPRYSQFPIGEIELAPKVFQHKRAADLETGVSGEGGSLANTPYNEADAGFLEIFETKDGKFQLAHGHNRHFAANRDGIKTVPIQVYREVDGWSPKSVKMKAFLRNITDGRLDALDIAQYLREIGGSEESLRGNINFRTREAQNGIGLVGLSQRIWEDVYGGKWGMSYGDPLSADKGAALGGPLRDNPAAQEAIYKRLMELQQEGKDYTPTAIRNMAEAGRLAVMTKKNQVNLFGENEAEVSLVVERGILTDYLKRELATEKNSLLAANRAQAILEAAGNTIKPEENKRIAAEAKEILGGFGKFKDIGGSETDNFLNRFAEELANARNKGEEDAVKKKATAEIYSALAADREAFTGQRSVAGQPSGAESGGQEIGGTIREGQPGADRTGSPDEVVPDETFFSLKNLDLFSQERPLSKLEKRLKQIQEKYPLEDPDKAAAILRMNPKATDEQVYNFSKASQEVIDKLGVATTAEAINKKVKPSESQTGLWGDRPEANMAGQRDMFGNRLEELDKPTVVQPEPTKEDFRAMIDRRMAEKKALIADNLRLAGENPKLIVLQSETDPERKIVLFPSLDPKYKGQWQISYMDTFMKGKVDRTGEKIATDKEGWSPSGHEVAPTLEKAMEELATHSRGFKVVESRPARPEIPAALTGEKPAEKPEISNIRQEAREIRETSGVNVGDLVDSPLYGKGLEVVKVNPKSLLVKGKFGNSGSNLKIEITDRGPAQVLRPEGVMPERHAAENALAEELLNVMDGHARWGGERAENKKELWEMTRDEVTKYGKKEGLKKSTEFTPIEHKLIKNMDELQETINYLMNSNYESNYESGYYFRSTPDIYKEIKHGHESTNKNTGNSEGGLSAIEIIPSNVSNRNEVDSALREMWKYAVGNSMESGKPSTTYIVKGERIGTGADGDPILNPKSIKVISKIDSEFLNKDSILADIRWNKIYPKDQYVNHRNIISEAISQGKPVPPEVLADYPDLRRKEGEKPKAPAITDVKTVRLETGGNEYKVTLDNGDKATVYRDPDNQSWYVGDIEGFKQFHFTDGFLGFNKAEALEYLPKKIQALEKFRKEQPNATERSAAPEGAVSEPENRPGGVPEAGEGRERPLADFKSRQNKRNARNAGKAQNSIWDDLTPASEEFDASPTVEAIKAKAEAAGIREVVTVADADFDAALVPEGNGKHTLVISENVGRGSHKQVADHDIFHRDVATDKPVARKFLEQVNPKTQAFADYKETLNRLRETMGFEPLDDKAMAEEIAADASSGLTRTRAGDGKEIDLREVFHDFDKAREALIEYRGEEGLPERMEPLPKEQPRPPTITKEKGSEDLTAKVGDVTLTQQTLFFSLKPGEEKQTFVNGFGEPVISQKEFERMLVQDGGWLEKMLRDPRQRFIPLYENEKFKGTAGGDRIVDAKGRPVEITTEELYKRMFDPDLKRLERGEASQNKIEDVLTPEGEEGPPGELEAPPQGIGKVVRAIKEIASAASLSVKAKITQIYIIKNLGWMAREISKAAKALEPYYDLFAKMSREDLIKFTDTVEMNSLPELAKKALDPNDPFDMTMLNAAVTWRRIADGLHYLRASLTPEQETAYWENYFPRLFKDPENAGIKIAQLLKSRGKSLTGTEGFEKQRSMLLFSDSIKPELKAREIADGRFEVFETKSGEVRGEFDTKAAANEMVEKQGGLGLEPLDNNYLNMMKANQWEQLRFLTGKMIEADLKEAGFLSKDKTPGHERLTGDKTLEGYYAHPDVARVLENFMSKGMRGNALFDAINNPTSFIKTLQVGLSAFHATFSIFSDLAHGIGSNLTRGIGAALTGRFSIAGHHMAELAKATNIRQNILRGARFIEEYQAPGTFAGEKFGETGTVSELVNLMDKAGIRVNATEKSQVWRSFAEALRDEKTGLPRQTLDLIAWPIMSYLVPRLKINATARLLQMELDAAAREGRWKGKDYQGPEGQKKLELEMVTLAQEVARKSDNIFGQMVYDNLSMKRGLRDSLHLLVGFPGWNIGSFTDLLQASQGIVHTVGEAGKAAGQLVTGQKPTWEAMSRSSRMSLEFYLGTVITMAIAGAITQRVLAGVWPEDAKDLMMPKTGALMSNGQAERIRFPTYMRDVLGMAHPVEMAKHKLNFPLRMFAEMTSNQNYFGEQIRDPYASAGTQAGQIAHYAGKSLLPFGMQGFLATESPAGKIMNMFGVTKVPRVFSNTPAMNVMDEYNQMNRAAVTSKQAGEEKQLKGELRKLAGNGDVDGFRQAAAEAMNKGKLTQQQIKGIVDESQEPTPGLGRFKALPIEWQLRAWDKASEAEKEAWKPTFLKKVMAAKPEILIRNRDALVPVLKDLGFSDAAEKVLAATIPEKAATKLDLSVLGIRKPAGTMGDTATVDNALSEAIQSHLDKLEGEKPTPKGFGFRHKKKKESPFKVLGF
jgi:hypothetical protein